MSTGTIITIAMCIISTLSVIINVFVGSVVFDFIRKNKKTNEPQVKVSKRTPRNLSFEECNNVIDTIVADVYTNKFLVTYILKNLQLIPDLDEEVKEITTEICSCFSEDVMNDILYYYKKEYFIRMITRRVQKLLIDYINTHKPNVK